MNFFKHFNEQPQPEIHVEDEDYSAAHWIEIKNTLCPICDYMAINIRDLKNHLFIAHEKFPFLSCNIEGCYYKSTSYCLLENHSKKEHNTTLSINCQVCNKIFRNFRGLYRHLSNMHSEFTSVLKCFSCNYVVGQNSRACLSKHIVDTHPELCTFTCNQCHFKTYNVASLNGHVRAKHRLYSILM